MGPDNELSFEKGWVDSKARVVEGVKAEGYADEDSVTVSQWRKIDAEARKPTADG